MPVLETLIELVARGRSIPVHLTPLPKLELLVAEVQAWKECASKTFLTENSPYSLLEVSLQPPLVLSTFLGGSVYSELFLATFKCFWLHVGCSPLIFREDRFSVRFCFLYYRASLCSQAVLQLWRSSALSLMFRNYKCVHYTWLGKGFYLWSIRI